MRRSNYKNTNVRVLIIPFLITTVIFIGFGFFMTDSIKNYYYNIKKEEAKNVARNISVNLANSNEAVDTINQLMEENLEISLEAISITKSTENSNLLSELAAAFSLDEVYVYNQYGVINYSYSGKYIGWATYDSHPVTAFMESGERIRFDDIRKDSESDQYYKYGYIKRDDGSFVQVGILAEKVQDFMERFQLQVFLDDVSINADIVGVTAYDKHFDVIATTNDKVSYANHLVSLDIINKIENDQIYDQLNRIGEQDTYEVYLPLDYSTANTKAFLIEFSMDSVYPMIQTNTYVGFAALILIYLSLVFVMWVTYRKNQELVKLAYFDTATNLPNSESLRQHLTSGQRHRNNKAVIVLNLENLDFINQSFGFNYSDEVLAKLGQRLSSIASKNTSIYRLSGNLIVFYTRNYKDRDDLDALVRRISNILNERIVVNTITIHLAFKIGIVEYNDTRNSIEQILADATIASNNVDLSKNQTHLYFDETMQRRIARDEIIEREIREALNDPNSKTLYLCYQPIYDIHADRIIGFEALARMNSPQLGTVSPSEFIAIAERSPLIVLLSNEILKQACMFIKSIIDLGDTDLRVAVNISTLHLLRDDFIASVLAIIDDTDIKGHNLELEITESIFMDNHELVNQKLKDLRQQSISIAIDDFGTGYSSFSRLSELNVDTLKIDQSFISSIPEANANARITRDIITIAHRLGLKTIAEGVELVEQLNYLKEYHCDFIQGYLFSKPLLKEHAVKLLKTKGEL